MASLENFFERLSSSSPFTDNRINGPSSTDIDVDGIHERQFVQLIDLAHEALDERRGLGAVLWGEAGIGKSHLLARLSRWAHRDKHACFVYLHNLQAHPDHLPRSLLQSVLSILTWGRVNRFSGTVLFHLVNAGLRAALQARNGVRYSWPAAERAYDAMVTRLSRPDPSRAALVDRTVYDVLLRFYQSAYLAMQGHDDERLAGLAVRWLSGEFLDPDEARLLRLPPGRNPNEPVALADNQQIKQVLVALTQLALFRGQPFLLCFDQVDNLDTDQAAALSRFLEALLDSSSNLLVVMAGVQATLVQWRNQKVIQDSAWDRLAQFEVPLQRISVREGREIVAARLRRYLEPFEEVEEVSRRVDHDPLFPLGRRWADEFLGNKIEVRPRDVITWARTGWRREQEALQQVGGTGWLAGWGAGRLEDGTPLPPTAEQVREAIDRKVAQKIAEHVALRRAEPHTLGPNADNLAGLVRALMEPLVEIASSAPSKPGVRPAYDWIVHQRGRPEDGDSRTGLLFLSTGSAHSATAALRRLVRDAERPERVLLVTDEREPLPRATRGREYYEQLQRRGDDRFQHVELSFAEYATLDALQAAIGLARSGDLEIELSDGQIRAVSEQEVIESHGRQGRYVAAPVLRELLAGRVAGAAGESRAV